MNKGVIIVVMKSVWQIFIIIALAITATTIANYDASEALEESVMW